MPPSLQLTGQGGCWDQGSDSVFREGLRGRGYPECPLKTKSVWGAEASKGLLLNVQLGRYVGVCECV
jgi:hypothetical protein